MLHSVVTYALSFWFLLYVCFVSALPSQFDSRLFERNEQESLASLRLQASLPGAEEDQTLRWLRQNATDVELLRWIRFSKTQDTRLILDLLQKHVAWRHGPLGVETVVSDEFLNTPTIKRSYEQLDQEIFWLGISQTGCPTLVIRTQLHDGAMYDEDANIFTSFLVHILELGRRRYGAGSERKICLLLDRSRVVLPSGRVKTENTDWGVIPKLLDLFTTLYANIYPNYPDILAGAQMAPSSFFFSLCYTVTSQVMDATTRSKFEMVSPGNLERVMISQFPRERLPAHLGGTSDYYGDELGHPLFNKEGGAEGGELAAEESPVEEAVEGTSAHSIQHGTTFTAAVHFVPVPLDASATVGTNNPITTAAVSAVSTSSGGSSTSSGNGKSNASECRFARVECSLGQAMAAAADDALALPLQADAPPAPDDRPLAEGALLDSSTWL